ncbi:tetratricopeptide repeat protein [Desulfurella multipotens]|uniref:tetratricopeptide repeat protein n=1 Tax=Desulfurella multipotens TaxID=79269 RepID=UPI000CAE4915|nr:tetratricopeptide repeat protein [Desulfurella multipotens]PMP64097.1 MAG: hypothetical protein C0192_06910 [Desulfurella multipotens]
MHISAYALNIDLRKIGGKDCFVVSNIQAEYKLEEQNGFLKIQILNKKANTQFYKALNNKFFDFVSLFNTSGNVNIIFGAKKGYELLTKKETNALIIEPKEILQESKVEKKENYIDNSLFKKPEFKISLIQTKPTIQNVFFSGLDAYSRHDYKLSIVQFSKLTTDPNNPFFLNALYLLASSYEKIGDFEKAIKTYRDILNYSLELDAPGKILYQIAQIYKKQGDSRYIDTLKKIVEEFPYSNYADKAKFELGNIFYDAKKYNQAILYYTSITKESPLYEIGMLKAGYIFYLEQNYPQAAYLFYLIDLKNVDVKDNEKYIAKAAYVFCKMKDFKSAENFLSYIQNTQSPDFYISKSECLLLQNNPNLALNTISQAIKVFPLNKQIQEEKTKIDLLTQKLNEQQLENIIKQYKNNEKITPLAMWHLAKVYYNKKEYAKVLNLYAKTLSSANVMDEFQNLAQDSLNMFADQSAKNFDEKSMHEALRLSNKLKLKLNSCSLAKSFMFIGQYKLAFDSVDKNSSCYKFIKANYDIQKGDLKSALSDLNSLKDKDYLNIIYGKLSYANGELSKAKIFFEKCVNSKDELLKQYAKLKLSEINIEKNIQNKPIDNKEFKGPFLTESLFLNAMYYFNKKDYANAINYFEKVENYKKYNEQALFYETLCLINLGKKELALKKLAILEKNYPNSTLTKKLKILLQ